MPIAITNIISTSVLPIPFRCVHVYSICSSYSLAPQRCTCSCIHFDQAIPLQEGVLCNLRTLKRMLVFMAAAWEKIYIYISVLVAWDLTFHPSGRGNALICKIKHVSVFVMCLKGTCIECFSQRGSPAKSGRKTFFVWTYSAAITPHDSVWQLPFLLNCLALLSITGFSLGHLCLALGEFILIIIYESSLLHFTIIISKTNHLHSHDLKPLSLMLIFHSVFV